MSLKSIRRRARRVITLRGFEKVAVDMHGPGDDFRELEEFLAVRAAGILGIEDLLEFAKVLGYDSSQNLLVKHYCEGHVIADYRVFDKLLLLIRPMGDFWAEAERSLWAAARRGGLEKSSLGVMRDLARLTGQMFFMLSLLRSFHGIGGIGRRRGFFLGFPFGLGPDPSMPLGEFCRGCLTGILGLCPAYSSPAETHYNLGMFGEPPDIFSRIGGIPGRESFHGRRTPFPIFPTIIIEIKGERCVTDMTPEELERVLFGFIQAGVKNAWDVILYIRPDDKMSVADILASEEICDLIGQEKVEVLRRFVSTAEKPAGE